MSATGRSNVRQPDDFYATPEWCTAAILRELGSARGALLDPACGEGAILEVARKLGHAPIGIELDAVRAGRAREQGSFVSCADALAVETWPAAADVIVMNPPFALAMDFVSRALAEARPKGLDVAALLRLPWLASKGRSAFHRANPSDVYVLSTRPEFAASIKCKGRKREKEDPRPACTWAVMQPIAAPRFPACPLCGSKVDTVTTDATDYAWLVWGPGRGGHWQILDLGGAS